MLISVRKIEEKLGLKKSRDKRRSGIRNLQRMGLEKRGHERRSTHVTIQMILSIGSKLHVTSLRTTSNNEYRILYSSSVTLIKSHPNL